MSIYFGRRADNTGGNGTGGVIDELRSARDTFERRITNVDQDLALVIHYLETTLVRTYDMMRELRFVNYLTVIGLVVGAVMLAAADGRGLVPLFESAKTLLVGVFHSL